MEVKRLDIPTRNLGRYIKEKGINLSNLSRMTKIPYVSLYDSLLNDNRERDLRAGEFCLICEFLEVDPMSFADERR